MISRLSFSLSVAIILFSVFSHFQCYSQTGENYINDLIPPSPEAQSMTMYGNSTVNLYNGIPDISVPVWEYKGKDLVFPIRLDYNSGGIKVADIASSVGLGWSLRAGGVVTREVRGLPDDMATYGYINSVALALPGNTTAGKVIAYNYMMDKIDSQQDMFFVNVNGIAFSFVLKKDGTVLKDPISNIKVTKVIGSLDIDAYGTITGWDITDENGVLYKFRIKEYTKSYSNSENNYYHQLKPHVSSWYLSEVITPFGDETINLTYESFTTSYTLPTNESYNPAYSEITSSVTLYSKKIKTINFPNETVTFTYDPSGYRKDLVGEKALKTITVSGGGITRTFNLSYMYMSDSGMLTYSTCSSGSNILSYRLILKEFEEAGIQPYIFDYYAALPARNSKSVDHWGFYNGQSNTTLCPLTYYYSTSSHGYINVGNANRKVYPSYTQKGTLYKITYPTGGYTEFEFENNVSCDPFLDYVIENKTYVLTGTSQPMSTPIEISNFSAPYIKFTFNLSALGECFQDPGCELFFQIRSRPTGAIVASTSFTKWEFDNGNRIKEVQANLANGTYDFYFTYSQSSVCDLQDPLLCRLTYTNELENVDSYAGGIRVKSVTDKLADGTISSQKTYGYTFSDNSSSGYILNHPVYLTLFDDYGNVCQDENSGFYFGMLSSNSRTLLGNTKGGPVGYARVIEKFVNGSENTGYIEYTFTSPNEQKDLYAWSPVSVFPFCPPSSFENFRGRLLTKKVYNNSNQIAHSETNEYSTSYDWEDIGNPNIKVARDESLDVDYYYFWDVYSNVYTLNLLKKTTKEEFYGSNTVTEIQYFTYENQYNKIKTKKWTTSIGKDLIETYHYPFDYVSGTNVYQKMINANMFNPIIKTELAMDSNQDGIIDETIEGTKTNYQEFYTGSYFPVSIERYESGTYNSKIAFDSYNTTGDLRQFHKIDDINTTYLWDATGCYVMAKIENATYSAVSSQNGQVYSYSSKTLYNSLKSLVPNALITTYSYKPLAGITQQTNSAGVTTYYEYDSLGRLSLIKNDDAKILKKIDYHYAD